MSEVSLALRRVLEKAKEVFGLEKGKKKDSPETPDSARFKAVGVGLVDVEDRTAVADEMIHRMCETDTVGRISRELMEKMPDPVYQMSSKKLITGTQEGFPFYIGSGLAGHEQVPLDSPQGTRYYDERAETVAIKDLVFGWVDLEGASPEIQRAILERNQKEKWIQK